MRFYYHARCINQNGDGKLIKQNIEKVSYFFHQAVTQDKPNNLQYAIQIMVNAKNFFTYADFLAASAEIELLPDFNSKQVEDILRRYKFEISAELPELFTKDNAYLKEIMIALILQLENVKSNKHKRDGASQEPSPQETEEELYLLHKELLFLSIAELQTRLDESWKEAGTLLSITGKIFLNRILKNDKRSCNQICF